jgi:hypothetical protein
MVRLSYADVKTFKLAIIDVVELMVEYDRDLRKNTNMVVGWK